MPPEHEQGGRHDAVSESYLGMALIEGDEDDERQGCECCRRCNTGGVRLFNGEVVISPLQIFFTLLLVGMFTYVVVDFLTKQYLIYLAELAIAWLEDSSFLLVIFCFIIFCIVWTVCMGFTSVACIGIGFVFSARWSFWMAMLVGTCAAFVGTAVGNVAAFALGRTILYPCAHALITRNKYLEGLDLAIFHHGGKINLLLRLAPIVPFTILNYGMGVTSSTLPDFCMGFIGGLPYIAAFVYLGTIVSSASGISDSLQLSAEDWCIVIAVGAVVLVVFSWYLYTYTKEELSGLLASAHRREQEITQGGQGSLSRRGSFAEHKASRSRRGSRG